jgi:hypothetical protein
MARHRNTFRSNFMSITYTYEIISVDEAARCMEVVYSAEGHQTMHIGARLPFEGESLEAVIKAFAPVPLWIELATPVVAPTVGLSGTIEPEPEPEPSPTPSSGEIPVTEV